MVKNIIYKNENQIEKHIEIHLAIRVVKALYLFLLIIILTKTYI